MRIPAAIVLLLAGLTAPICRATTMDCSAPGFTVGCFGLQATASINTTLPTTSEGGGPFAESNSIGSPVLLNQIESALIPFSYGNSVTAYDPVGNALYTLSASASINVASVDGKTLHAWAMTNGSSGGAPDLEAGGSANVYVAWFDTLYVGGLPAGTPVTLQITDTVRGSLLLTGDTTGSQITQGLAVSNLVSTGPCSEAVLQNAFVTSTPISSTSSLDLCTVSGATLTLSEYIEDNISGSANWSGSGDLSDTSDAFVDSLTPGATVTSASGLNYATPASTVPEPSPLTQLSIGCLILAVCRPCRLYKSWVRLSGALSYLRSRDG